MIDRSYLFVLLKKGTKIVYLSFLFNIYIFWFVVKSIKMLRFSNRAEKYILVI